MGGKIDLENQFEIRRKLDLRLIVDSQGSKGESQQSIVEERESIGKGRKLKFKSRETPVGGRKNQEQATRNQ